MIGLREKSQCGPSQNGISKDINTNITIDQIREWRKAIISRGNKETREAEEAKKKSSESEDEAA